MSVYLYRALCLIHEDDAFSGDAVAWPGMSLGRATGYLSRSSAVAAGRLSGYPFEIVRSEPVVFLTRAEKIQAQIVELETELSHLVAVNS